jgi:hypothetical protein
LPTVSCTVKKNIKTARAGVWHRRSVHNTIASTVRLLPPNTHAQHTHTPHNENPLAKKKKKNEEEEGRSTIARPCSLSPERSCGAAAAKRASVRKNKNNNNKKEEEEEEG